MTAAVTTARPVYLTREGEVFRLSFRFHPALVEQVKKLPFAAFDPDTRTWTTRVCAQAVQALRGMYHQGLVDTPVDTLLADGEDPAPCKAAVLRSGTTKRPYYVHLAMRGDNTFDRLKSLPGARWDKKAQALTFPPQASVALAELVDRGVVDDPDRVLTPSGTVVAFDTRSGRFVVRGPDPRAAAAFHASFPHAVDIVAAWQARGLEVDFADAFSAEVYRGELARQGPGFQPQGFRYELYPYQKKNVAVALERTGFGIFDAPGLGKTAQGIAVGMELLARRQVTRVIAIVPAGVRTQWKNEIVRMTGCSPFDVVVVTGDRSRRHDAYAEAANTPWMVVHYDVLARDKAKLAPLFNGALVVADEAHRLKTWNAVRTRTALALVESAARRLALTGTPTETHPGEFYQVLSGFACPGVLGTPGDFNERYRYKESWGGYTGARNIAELRERSRPHYARHTKEQVATHLPPLRVQQLILDPDPAYAGALRRAHREAAKEIRDAARARLHGGRVLLDQALEEQVATGAEMTATTMLRLLVDSPRLVAQSASPAAEALRNAGVVPDEDGPKLDELRVRAAEFKATQDRRKEAMAAAGKTTCEPNDVHGERFVVFTFSKTMANLISERFTEDGIPHVMFTGDTSAADRDAAVAAFTDPNSDVIAFVATDAGAEGLNLGRCCSTLINFDLAWTPSRQQQRANRIHRLDGTAPSYLVLNFVLAGTCEVGVARLLEERANLQDALFGEQGGKAKTTGTRTRSRSLLEEALSEMNLTTGTDRVKAAKAKAGKKPLPPPVTGGPPDGEPEQMALL